MLVWLIGCSIAPTGKDATTDFASAGGFEIRSGPELTLLAIVVGPGDDCTVDGPPLALGDLDGDGATDLAMTCRDDDGVVVHLLDGDAALDGRLEITTSVDVGHYDVGDMADLDGDGVRELAFGEDPDLADPEWTVRPSTAFDTAWTIRGLSDRYVEAPPVEAGDLDRDGVPDLAVWQHADEGSTISVVSGAALRDNGEASVSAPILVVTGVPEGVELVAPAPGGALVVASDSGEFYGPGGPPAELWVGLGPTFDDGMRIRGAVPGRARTEFAAAVPDLDGDGAGELVVLLGSFDSSEHNHTELATIPGAVLAAALDVDAAPYALGGIPADEGVPSIFVVCDLDGDGLPELSTGDEGGTWSGTSLATAGALPSGPPLQGHATCGGDLDGVPGAELLVGVPWLTGP